MEGFMAYDIQVMDVPQGYLAVLRGTATFSNLSQRIRELFDQVYGQLAKGTVRQDGQNVVLYWGAPGRNLLATPEGCPIEVGVQVAAPFESDGGLISSATPGGMVATVVHWGPYEEMGKAYDALIQWRLNSGRTFAGPAWEVYGNWSDDPSQVRTDVFLLLA
jgi:effector-binding domain-containing protein